MRSLTAARRRGSSSAGSIYHCFPFLRSMSLYLTPAQIAERLAVTHDRVLDWIASRELPAHLVGRQRNAKRPTYRVSVDDLDSFLLRRRTEVPAPKRRKRKLPPVTKYF